MECNKDEAVRAKDIAQRKMINNDFEGGRKFGLKAQKLFPELENISQMLAVCDVHCAANREMNGGAKDLYGILQVERSADVATIKKQYRKLAFVLHPDKNHFPGAESAFKLVGEANMILSDNGKRSLYDYTCRDPANSTILKQQNPQGNQSSQSGDQNKYPNGHQKSHSDSKVQPSFWTFCPFCKRNYQYYRDLVNKRIKCPKCLKFFIAIDIGACKSKQSPHTGHDGVQNVKLGTTSLQHEEVGKQKKAKVDPQRAEPSVSHTGYQPPQSTKHGDAKVDPQRAELSFSHPAYQPQFSKNGDAEVGGSCRGRNVENGDIKTKGGKEGAANKGTGRMSDSDRKNVGSSKQSHKRSHVSNSEEAVADFGPEKRYRLRKSSSDIKDKQKEIPADAELNKENNKSDSDSEHDSEPVYVDVLDLEFSNFDKDKEEHCFAVDQIWAIYDTIDSMPRFYAQIRKVYSSGFRLRIAWLEADPEDPLERNWAEKGLPVACGKFKHGDSEVTKDRLMFSHQMAFEKGSKRFSFVIYPKKGEIWALFKDWDITKWSSDPKNHMKFKFEIVEILSDFDKENGVLVAYMVKVEGFVSLFQKSSRAQLAECRVPSSDLFRFSHHIPSLKLTGNERAGVPVGSCELDTASLPDDLDQFYFSKNVKAKPGNVSSAKKSASSHQSPKKKVKKDNLNQSTGVQNKSNFATSEKGSGPSCQDDDVNISSTKLTKSHSPDDKGSKMIIHNFSLDKQNWVFEEGQIWALGRSNNVNLRCYAQIKKIESTPLRLYVDLLELCSDTVRPFACGIYKASTGGRQIFQRDSFLYLVKAEVNGRNRFNIFPRKNEIWVLCKKQNAECTFDDADAGDCDIVEVVESDGDIIKVLPLTRVGGYQSVFKGVHKVVEVSIDESHRFFYQVPAVHLTDEEDGRLRGFWELDLAEFPGLVLS